MATKIDIKDYRPKLSPETRDDLMDLARDLEFIVTQPGRYYGEPSPAIMLEALAEAYTQDPAGVALALKAVGVYSGPNLLKQFRGKSKSQ